MGWKEKFSFLETKTIVSTVGGHEVKFSPASVGVVFKLKALSGPIAAVIATFMDDGKKDQTNIFRNFAATESSPAGEETQILATTPELARERARQRTESTERLAAAILDPENKLLIGRLIADSAREVFDRGTPDAEISGFMDAIDVGTLVEFLVGVGRANKSVFGPLGDRLASAAKEALAGLKTPASQSNAAAAGSEKAQA